MVDVDDLNIFLVYDDNGSNCDDDKDINSDNDNGKMK